MNGFDWNLLGAFITVAEKGSLTAAAQGLKVSQPTVGRHIDELEDQLGLTLFERHPRGLTLTEAGQKLLETALDVEAGCQKLSRMAAGESAVAEGVVRISASEVVAHYVLPPILAVLREREPAIQLEIVADNSVANLLRRDADIALRMFRPHQEALITRQLVEADFGLFAHRNYLARYGTIRDLDDFEGHTVLGYDRHNLHLRTLRAMGHPTPREAFSLRCDAQAFHVEAARAGVGIAALISAVARRIDGLQPILPELNFPGLPIWLVTHEAIHRSPRIQAVNAVLVEGVQAFFADD